MFSLFKRPEVSPETEDALTPLEILALLARQPRLRDAFRVGRYLKEHAPKRFVRSTLVPGVDHCTANLGAGRLLVCFAGRTQRFMAPVSVFLQMIDDRASDLLLLFDRQKRHFNDGVDGFGNSLPALAHRISAFADQRNYRSIVTVGWSMGGLPALRAGRLMGATRAISIGGRLVWHVERLKTRTGLEAFDPLCSCIRGETPCFLLYGGGHAADARDARIVLGMVPRSKCLEVASEKHNAVHQYFEAGSLPRLYELLTDEEREPRQTDIDSLPI